MEYNKGTWFFQDGVLIRCTATITNRLVVDGSVSITKEAAEKKLKLALDQNENNFPRSSSKYYTCTLALY